MRVLPPPMQLARLPIGLFVFLGQNPGSIGARREKIEKQQVSDPSPEPDPDPDSKPSADY